MAALILDASVVIGLLDTADTHHAQAVDDVEAADLAGRPLLVPASAYSETVVAFARDDRINDARDALTDMGIIVAPLTDAIAERAAQLRASHPALRLPDALVLATAARLDGELLTYDQRLTKISAGRQVNAP